MKVINMGNIADAFRFDDLPATGIVIEATHEELENLPNLVYKEVEVKAKEGGDIDLSAVGAVCDDCARLLGFTPKDKVVGVWIGKCGICHQNKTCTDLWHDWNPPKRGGAK